MRTKPTLALVVSSILLGTATTQAQPADLSGTDVLTSTEHWTEADTNEDGTLSQSELDRAAPTLSADFESIDRNGDRQIARDEIEAWQADPEAGSLDADEDVTPDVADEDEALTPDDGDTDSELTPDVADEDEALMPEDANDDTLEAGEVAPDEAAEQ